MTDGVFLGLSPNGWIALLTLVLAWIGAVQTFIYSAQHRTTKVIERAYVDLSHKDRLVLVANSQTDIGFGVKNHGRTPADILSVNVTAMTIGWNEALPAIPSYDRGVSATTTALLMPGEQFEFGANLPVLPAQTVDAIQSGKRILLLVGFVEYLDRFGTRHRGGYGRRYNPKIPGNNLIFEMKPGYNYDVEVDNHGNQREKLAHKWATNWRKHRSEMGLT